MAFDREFYIVKGAKEFAPQNLPVVFYNYEMATGKPAAQCFVGRAKKPTWHYQFDNEERRQHRINEQIKAVAMKEQRKAEQKAKRAAFETTLAPGDILVSAWGYEQTNVDFFKVISRVGKQTVELVKIPNMTVEGSEQAHGMACNVLPHLEYDTSERKPFRARVSPSETVKISSVSYASRWQGKPVYCSWYG